MPKKKGNSDGDRKSPPDPVPRTDMEEGTSTTPQKKGEDSSVTISRRQLEHGKATGGGDGVGASADASPADADADADADPTTAGSADRPPDARKISILTVTLAAVLVVLSAILIFLIIIIFVVPAADQDNVDGDGGRDGGGEDCHDVNPSSQCACHFQNMLDFMDDTSLESYYGLLTELGRNMGHSAMPEGEELVDNICDERNHDLWWSAVDLKRSSPISTADLVEKLFQRHALIYLFANWDERNWNMTLDIDLDVQSSAAQVMDLSPKIVLGYLDYGDGNYGVDECKWLGVGCNANGIVEELHLGRLDLVGAIPTRIALLTSLKLLKLNDNGLSGVLPRELWTMSNLTTIDISDNFFEGTISPEVSSMVNLENLSLRFNYFTGSLPSELFGLVDMLEMDLHMNQFTGFIPENIGNRMSLLRSIDLGSNELNGTLPESMRQLISLEELSIHNTLISGTIPGALLAAMKETLFHLRLDNNIFVGTLPTELAQLTMLTYFDVRNNFLTGSIPTEFGSLVNAELVSFQGNDFTSTIPTEMARMTSLQSIHFSNTLLEGPMPEGLCALRNGTLQSLRADCTPNLECSCCTGMEFGGAVDCDENDGGEEE